MWKEAYLANVLSADPMELVCLLYRHALDNVREARRHLANHDIAERAKAISKAIAIIGELLIFPDGIATPRAAYTLVLLAPVEPRVPRRASGFAAGPGIGWPLRAT